MSEGTAAVAGGRGGYRWLVLSILVLVYIFNFLDRQLMSILTEPIKAELGLTDRQMGLMTGFYFALMYTVLGVFCGYLADRSHRVRILAAGCAIWSAFTIMCGMAKTYPVMLAARMGVGVGEAAGAPPSYSIISDYFPAQNRGVALAVFSLGVPFGMALGAGVGGTIAATWGWRAAFIWIGAAGLIAAMILLLFVREPRRGAFEPEAAPGAAAEPPPSLAGSIGAFFSRPSLVYAALGCGFCAFIGYANLNWTPAFLTRAKGINMGEIALYYSLMIAISAGAGTLLSGWMVDWLGRRGKIWYALLPMIAVILGVPFHVAFLLAPDWQTSLAFLAVPTFLNIFYLAPALAVVQNALPPRMRATGGALLLLVNNLIGLGGGPTFVGDLSTRLEPVYGSAGGLQAALMWLLPFYGVAVVFLALEALALRRESRG